MASKLQAGHLFFQDFYFTFLKKRFASHCDKLKEYIFKIMSTMAMYVQSTLLLFPFKQLNQEICSTAPVVH